LSPTRCAHRGAGGLGHPAGRRLTWRPATAASKGTFEVAAVDRMINIGPRATVVK